MGKTKLKHDHVVNRDLECNYLGCDAYWSHDGWHDNDCSCNKDKK